MTRLISTLFLAAFIGTVIFMPDLNAQSAQIAEIIYVTGAVKIKTSTAPDWVDAREGMTVKEGDIIKTEDNSKAEVAFGEQMDNIINIFPNSQLVMSKFEPGLIQLEQGRVFSLVKKLKHGSTFEIRTPTAVAGARGTGWGVGFANFITDISGYNKTIYTAGLDESGSPLDLKNMGAGWRTKILKGQGPGAFLRLTKDEMAEWEKWVKEAKDRLNRYKQKPAAPARSGRIKSRAKMIERVGKTRMKILERVESETSRSDEIKRERRSEGGGSEDKGTQTRVQN